jgi:hypothetical protein
MHLLGLSNSKHETMAPEEIQSNTYTFNLNSGPS